MNLRIELPRRSLVLLALAVLMGITTFEIRPGVAQAAATGQEPVATGQKLRPEGLATLHKIIDTANDPDLLWPDFSPYRDSVPKFYEAGEVHFLDDIYGYDAELEKDLAKGYPLSVVN
jgi:hypothetical protein